MRKLMETVEKINEDPATRMPVYIENEINDLKICISELDVLSQDAATAGNQNRVDYLQNAIRMLNAAISNLEHAKGEE